MDQKRIAVGIVLLFLGSSVTSILVEANRNESQSSLCEKTINIFENMKYDLYRFPEGYPNVSVSFESIKHTEYIGVTEPVESLSGNSLAEDSPWPMQGHDATHSGRGAHGTELNYGQSLWEFDIHSSPYDSPVIDNEGTIYIGTGDLYALHPDGTIKWIYDIPGSWTEIAPAVGEDGTIYLGTSRGTDDHFFAINPNGTRKWVIATEAIRASPVISPDGTIIFPNSHANKLVAMHPNGTKKWEFPTNHVIYSTPAVGPDGTVYVGSHDCYIYAVNPDGTQKWSFLTGSWVHGSPSIGSDGIVYCGSDGGYLYALYPNNGSMKWRLAIGASYASPTIGLDGTLYIGVWEKRFYAINPNGTIQWTFDTSPGKLWGSTAALSADGTLYFGTADLEWSGGIELIALWINGTVKWRQPLNTVFSSPAIGSDGTVYIGRNSVNEGYLCAFGYGPLRAEANGPYTGDDQTQVQFKGTVYGGMPPFTFHWDFEDCGTSSEQNPAHKYESVGTYTATFTVMDSEGTENTDSANVTVTYALPSLTLIKPVDAVYIMNLKVYSFPEPTYGAVVIGPIVVAFDAYQKQFGIDRVEFYLDGKLVATDTRAPYRWVWITPAFGEHVVSAFAYDGSGNRSKEGGTSVLKFF